MFGAVAFPSQGRSRSQLAHVNCPLVKSSTRWILYSLFRVGLFAAALAAMLLLGLEWWAAAIVGIGIIIVFQHRSNIDRLLKGTERKFGNKETPSAAA